MLLLLSEMDRDANAFAALLAVTETDAIPSEIPSLSEVRFEEELRRRGSILPSHLGPVA
jgi:hypothetical protein